ncbi:MAG: calcium-binding protein [Sporolactobacillus sp.]
MEDAWEKRLRDILENSDLRGEDDDDLPMVTSETLETYLNYLKKHLIFPFAASYERETGFLSAKTYDVKVMGLNDEIDDFYGLICAVKLGRKKRYIPMGDLEVRSDDPNYHLIDDYNTWFWNFR